MKKFLIAALAVLVGSLGYTVVDKTIESRVATLESQVESLDEGRQLSTTIEPISTNVVSHLEIGDHLKWDQKQTKFLIRDYGDFIRPVSVGEDAENDFPGEVYYPSYSKIDYSTIPPRLPGEYYPEYFLYLKSVDSEVVDSQDVYRSIYDSDYSIKFIRIDTKTEIKITVNGSTDPLLSGKELKFSFDNSVRNNSIVFVGTILNDGSFSITKTVSFSEKQVPTSISLKPILTYQNTN